MTGFRFGINLYEGNRGEKMSNHNDFIKDSSSILEEIESQLNQALEKKKKEIEDELEEKINREKEEAHQKITKIETELNQDKKTLQDYRGVISEFDQTKHNIKEKIQGHLDKASEFQNDIDTLAEKTLEELRAVSELNARLEETGKEAADKIKGLKTDLQDKYGITAELPDSSPGFSSDFDLDGELNKLRKIKELLDLNGSNITLLESQPDEGESHFENEPEMMDWSSDLKEMEPSEEKTDENIDNEEEAPIQNEIPVSEKEEEIPDQPPAEAGPAEDEHPPHQEQESIEEKYFGQDQPETEEQPLQEEATGEAVPEQEEEKSGTSFLDRLKRFASGKNEGQEKVSEALEQYRKSEGSDEEGKVIYYENQGNAILDGEQIIWLIENCLQESAELYEKLMNTESPKDQFFIKQEIIKQQESARKFMLNCIRICEQKDCVFPEATRDFFNADVLKDILERVSMENWSNHEDFERISVYIEDLAQKYRDAVQSPEVFADNLVERLKKAT